MARLVWSCGAFLRSVGFKPYATEKRSIKRIKRDIGDICFLTNKGMFVMKVLTVCVAAARGTTMPSTVALLTATTTPPTTATTTSASASQLKRKGWMTNC